MLDRTVIALAAISLMTPALAQDARRQLDAHAHGVGRLAIAIDGKSIEIELEAPANDILGFEHAPKTAAHKKIFADAKKRLAKLDGLFVITPAAGCALKSSDVDVLGAAAGGASKGHDHAHDHGAKGEAKGGDAHDHGAHSEFRVTYKIACSDPAKLGTVAFDYFKAFKGAEKLNVTVIGPKGQSGYEVTRDKPVLDLSGVS